MSAAAVVGYDPLLDKRYQQTRLGRDVADFLAWMELGGAASRTLDQYERDLSRGCLMFPATPIGEWSDAELLHVARSFKPAERRVRVAAWRSFFKWARQTRRVAENPTETLPAMKRPKQRLIDVFTDEEIKVLEDLPIRDGALMQILFDVGLRKGEARRLRLMHVGAEEVRILRGKGDKDRAVRMTVRLTQRINELALLEGLGQRDYLWYTRPGGGQIIDRAKPIGEGSFDRWWRRCLEDAGVRYRNPHTTRHTFATRWLKAGGRLSTLRKAMGHASSSTTSDLYEHLDTADQAADLALIEGIRPD